MNLHAPSQDGHIGEAVRQSIRPVLLSTAVAASIFASLPMAAHADSFDGNFANHFVVHSESSSASITSSTYSPAMMSSLELASSSLAAPIGELQDGSDTGIQSSLATFGQWFFLLYVVVSLLAGGKEVLVRIQKQMDKDS
eukprot:CAMPEP_0201938312 /NCGR_PEP_ID=MMETSP0903-20130614/41176_1 /ASSEMBLY_ACC=CAM_ASM_000552 /TAXON_ID=420261 /ORGANISM="Thalassiosira antarctica, Strain CCMP982" /LENGTH=139 /DNA_ID=CAMNT_0048479547 /DNA_START=72 /DNA_END=491 /DNA_ORIENTATION=-